MSNPKIQTATTDNSGVPSRDDILARTRDIAAVAAKDAARRERQRELPFEIFGLIKEARIGTLRIPEAKGGPGGSIADYIEVLMILGEADSNIPHALRSHFNFTENLALTPIELEDRRHLENVLTGKLFAGASTEQGTKRPGEITTRLSADGDRYRLNGRKWYATGTAFADFGTFSAVGDDEQPIGVLIPLDRPGITILDDWDSMGQRMTASGGVLLENVEVLPHELTTRKLGSQIGRHSSAMRQLHLAASAAGAVQGALNDGIDYVLRQARTTLHSSAETANQDPFVQKMLGEISAGAFAVKTLIREAARTLDRTAAAFSSGDEEAIEAALLEGSLATARTQIIASQLSLTVATNLYELGGGSATSSERNFDRHWRNIRTVYNHNPLAHKARVIGDYYLNGTTTHLREGRVF
ncbi:acyl-CoA dehydrogenase [Rhizobium rhizogenes]|uniref:Acyl-CoA dehydrogenase n=2 Tax=Rhizobium/Agrobacterium group TaxID=227290 RepID=A0AB36EI02_AGRTU|nr:MULTISPECIES: acyl-CoA dehydrogenase family protein [Rhizobium/Agrobacterium group]MDP9758524.1 alkylation response protein AidB-like acyl-CoA dehydrogenase [Agrobacterium tumefaciens]MDQ1219765.1 alkylation response protein AidB-like acyl-CoA dehydrogenase [Agrobacterium sp. SORGH_AS_0745]OCJ37692.1 acyl-CoA dehydrogenase [Agrobacterium tumefaciens]TRA89011.1 acyl-CoA dehydrogenase [Rhizobium rhizogenes]